MQETYTALIKQTDHWWIGWIEEIPGVNCQEATKEELLESLRLTLQEAIEFNRLSRSHYIVKFYKVLAHPKRGVLY